MKTLAAFAAPEPVALRVHSSLSRRDVITRLDEAVGERRYSSPDRNSPGFFRLGGSATDERVTVRARPYIIPGVIAGSGAMTIEFAGEVATSDDGSEIKGTVSAPVRWTTTALLTVVLIAWMAFGIMGNGSTWATWTFVVLGGLLITTGWALIIRRNQRMALQNVDELGRMLASIVSDRHRQSQSSDEAERGR